MTPDIAPKQTSEPAGLSSHPPAASTTPMNSASEGRMGTMNIQGSDEEIVSSICLKLFNQIDAITLDDT
jgi:hypothetical protein